MLLLRVCIVVTVYTYLLLIAEPTVGLQSSVKAKDGSAGMFNL